MSPRLTTRRLATIFAVTASLIAVCAAPALADQVIADDLIVNGNICAGPPLSCDDGHGFGSQYFRTVDGDTPGINLIQDASGGFSAYQWDVAGNEANFFIRDMTAGSQLPFRIFPGARTGSIRLEDNTTVSSTGLFQQSVGSAQTLVGPPDTAAILAAVRTLPLENYTLTDDTTTSGHLRPNAAAFRLALGLGDSDTRLADLDVATAALAAVRELDSRVSTLSLTPLPAGVDALPAQMTAANSKIKKLETANKKMAKSLKKLQKQMKKLAKG
ncbi:MAG: hypothetical protein WAP35_08710 [Solirubrobacterales bacterium]